MIISNCTILFRPGFHCHQFLQVLSHFRGFEPQLRRIFFLKSDTKWSFFIYSNILESLVINLRGHTTSKLKFVQEMSKIVIAIYLCGIYSLKYLKYLGLEIASGYGVVVSTLDFKPIECRFGSWSRQALFYFFSPQNKARPEEVYGNERVGEISE